MHLPEPINSDAKLSYSTRSRRSWVVSRSRILLLVLVSFGTVWFQSQRLFPRAQIKHKPGSKDGLKVIEAYAFERLIGNIGGASNESFVPNVRLGTVVASPATAAPDYFYAWTRDGAFAGKLLVDLFYETKKNNSEDDWTRGQSAVDQPRRSAGWEDGVPKLTRPLRIVAEDWILSESFHQRSAKRSPFGLGEPKFLVDGSLFTGPWGRPQADGPGLRATAMMKFARIVGLDNPFVRSFLYHANLDGRSLIKNDLEWLSHNWQASSFDLWEELDGQHFFTKQVQRRALAEGARFATDFNDPGAAVFYQKQADDLAAQLQTFWSEQDGRVNAYSASGRSGIDCAVLLGVNHGWNQSTLESSLDESQFGPATQRILATTKVILDAFRTLYPINKGTTVPAPGLIGRYPEDEYSGFERNGGNPWYLCTFAAAETLYNAATVFTKAEQVAVTKLTLDFFTQFASVDPGVYRSSDLAFTAILDGIRQQADGLVQLATSYAFANGSMSEQIDASHGDPVGARDLTWSYTAFLTAQRAAVGKPVF